MADEPFALSTSPPALPAEGDFDAILTAVMGTMRGRWFLDEYARRNRNADTLAVLAAIERIEGVMRERQAQQAQLVFRTELLDLALTIARTRADVAQPPEPDRAGAAAPPAQDNSIAGIGAAARRLSDIALTMRERGIDPSTCAQIEQLTATILSAASLRNPDDPRVRRLAEGLQYLEWRIDAMLDRQAAEPAGSEAEATAAPAEASASTLAREEEKAAAPPHAEGPPSGGEPVLLAAEDAAAPMQPHDAVQSPIDDGWPDAPPGSSGEGLVDPPAAAARESDAAPDVASDRPAPSIALLDQLDELVGPRKRIPRPLAANSLAAFALALEPLPLPPIVASAPASTDAPAAAAGLMTAEPARDPTLPASETTVGGEAAGEMIEEPCEPVAVTAAAIERPVLDQAPAIILIRDSGLPAAAAAEEPVMVQGLRPAEPPDHVPVKSAHSRAKGRTPLFAGYAGNPEAADKELVALGPRLRGDERRTWVAPNSSKSVLAFADQLAAAPPVECVAIEPAEAEPVVHHAMQAEAAPSEPMPLPLAVAETPVPAAEGAAVLVHAAPWAAVTLAAAHEGMAAAPEQASSAVVSEAITAAPGEVAVFATASAEPAPTASSSDEALATSPALHSRAASTESPAGLAGDDGPYGYSGLPPVAVAIGEAPSGEAPLPPANQAAASEWGSWVEPAIAAASEPALLSDAELAIAAAAPAAVEPATVAQPTALVAVPAEPHEIGELPGPEIAIADLAPALQTEPAIVPVAEAAVAASLLSPEIKPSSEPLGQIVSVCNEASHGLSSPSEILSAEQMPAAPLVEIAAAPVSAGPRTEIAQTAIAAVPLTQAVVRSVIAELAKAPVVARVAAGAADAAKAPAQDQPAAIASEIESDLEILATPVVRRPAASGSLAPVGETEVLSAAWETAVGHEASAPAADGVAQAPVAIARADGQPTPSMWDTPAATVPDPSPASSVHAPERPADEPADFLLEPLPPPVMAMWPAQETPPQEQAAAPSAPEPAVQPIAQEDALSLAQDAASTADDATDPMAEIERELFEPMPAAAAATTLAAAPVPSAAATTAAVASAPLLAAPAPAPPLLPDAPHASPPAAATSDSARPPAPPASAPAAPAIAAVATPAIAAAATPAIAATSPQPPAQAALPASAPASPGTAPASPPPTVPVAPPKAEAPRPIVKAMPRHAPNDPLAGLNAMSAEELIALFT